MKKQILISNSWKTDWLVKTEHRITHNMVLNRFRYLLVGVALSSNLGFAESEGESLESQFLKSVAELNQPVEDLKKKYRKQLEVAAEAAQKEGELDKLVLIRGEIKKVNPEPLPEFEVHSDLSRLRGIYDRELERIEQNQKRKLKEIGDDFTRRFDVSISNLTREGKMEEALKIKKVKEELLSTLSRAFEEEVEQSEIPTSEEELVEYLTGTIWSWNTRAELRVVFSEGQLIHGIEKDSDEIRWSPHRYQVTPDLEVTYGGYWRIEFDSKFRRLETIATANGNLVAKGKLLEKKKPADE